MLFVLWFVLCRALSNEWSINEQYNYGWFVPVFALFLFWQRWEDRPLPRGGSSKPQAPSSKGLVAIAAIAMALLLPLRVFEIGNPDWRPLGWLHAAIVVSLTFLVVFLIGGTKWVRHFAFPIAFIFVAVPWVTPIEAPIVQGLMRMVAGVVCETINLCGIPAQLEGSVIRTANGVVGVNEACSGVRSLQTSIMVGLLFGELKRLTTGRRVALLVSAVAIALGANFLRAFLLVWIAATKGLPATERWHDVAGYSILIAVFIGTLALASWLARRKLAGTSQAVISSTSQDVEEQKVVPPVGFAPSDETPSQPQPHGFHLSTSALGAKRDVRGSFPLSNFNFLLCSLVWLLLVEAGAIGWYRMHETHLVPRVRWTVQWPANSPGFHEVRIDENVRRTLRYDEGRGVVWHSETGAPLSDNSLGSEDKASSQNYLLYFFRWQSGSSSVLRARAHRPDICLPNTGWEVTADDGLRGYPTDHGLHLPFRHFEFVRQRAGSRPQFAHAFFCVREDWIKANAKTTATDLQMAGKPGGWMRSDRLRVVLEGERDLGQQVMELVMVSPDRVSREKAEAQFAAMLPRLIRVEKQESKAKH